MDWWIDVKKWQMVWSTAWLKFLHHLDSRDSKCRNHSTLICTLGEKLNPLILKNCAKSWLMKRSKMFKTILPDAPAAPMYFFQLDQDCYSRNVRIIDLTYDCENVYDRTATYQFHIIFFYFRHLGHHSSILHRRALRYVRLSERAQGETLSPRTFSFILEIKFICCWYQLNREHLCLVTEWSKLATYDIEE